MLRDVIIISKTGTPNIAAHFCTGRSTNARTAWIDKNGKSYGEVFPKTKEEEQPVSKPQIESPTSSDEPNFLSSCISRVAKETGTKLTRKSGNAYVSADGRNGYVFRTSKIYKQGGREKYWYAYKRNNNIAKCDNKYYVFGCHDANTIVIIPVSEIESQIDSLNFSQDGNGNPSYWHIVFFKDNKGRMTWLLSKPKVHEIDITNKLL